MKSVIYLLDDFVISVPLKLFGHDPCISLLTNALSVLIQCLDHRCVCVCVLSHFSHVQLFATIRTVALQAPLSMGIFQARILEWVAMHSSRGSFQPRDQTQVSHIAGGLFTI